MFLFLLVLLLSRTSVPVFLLFFSFFSLRNVFSVFLSLYPSADCEYIRFVTSFAYCVHAHSIGKNVFFLCFIGSQIPTRRIYTISNYKSTCSERVLVFATLDYCFCFFFASHCLYYLCLYFTLQLMGYFLPVHNVSFHYVATSFVRFHFTSVRFFAKLNRNTVLISLYLFHSARNIIFFSPPIYGYS